MQDLLQLKEANDKKIYLQFPGGDNHSGPFKSEEEAEQKLVWLYESVFTDENVMNRNMHMMKLYKNLPPRWGQ